MRKVYRVTIDSPYGKRPLEQFEHWLNKVADEALTRWGIDINFNREPPKARFQIVGGDGAIMGEVHARTVGASIADRVEDALKEEYGEPVEIKRVEEKYDDQASKDDFETQ